VAGSLSAVPSSALYFGGYGAARSALNHHAARELEPIIPALSAFCGNAASSMFFVPKEIVKQRLMRAPPGASAWQVLTDVLRTQGPSGLYLGYRAAMLRNVPSAVVRFTLYEQSRGVATPVVGSALAPALAGGLSGALSSFLTTPLDVVRTQMASGALPRGTNWLQGLRIISRRYGARGLLSGAGNRVLWSSMFSAIGFACFERALVALDVSAEP